MNRPSAGWYHVPGTNQEGYWDGLAWTPHRRPMTMPPTGFRAPGVAAGQAEQMTPHIGATQDATQEQWNQRVSGPAMAGTTGWVRRHKVATVLIAVLAVGSCGALLDSEDEPAVAKDQPAAATTKEPEAPVTTPPPPPPPPPPVLTKEETWQAQLDEDRKSLIVPLAAALGVKRSLVREQSDSAVDACTLAVDGKPLKQRMTKFAGSLGEESAVTPDQAIDGLSVVLENLCPEAAPLHKDQVRVRDEAIRKAAEKARKQRALEERRRAEAAAREQARIQQEREQAAHVYFENCTAARAAGAAPVRRGEPGYGTHLDRDGDGIGCE